MRVCTPHQWDSHGVLPPQIMAWDIGSILKRAFLRALRASRVQLLVVRLLKPRITASPPLAGDLIVGENHRHPRTTGCFSNIYCIVHSTLTSWDPNDSLKEDIKTGPIRCREITKDSACANYPRMYSPPGSAIQLSIGALRTAPVISQREVYHHSWQIRR